MSTTAPGPVPQRRIKGFGWKPDLPDPRDRIFNLEDKILRPTQVPPTVDLTPQMPPVYDQLQLGSCVSNGWAAVMEQRAMQQGEGVNTPSRLFIYYNGRVIEGDPLDQDTGLEVRTGAKVVSTLGAPPETDWPYSDADPGPFQQKPSDQAYADATKHEALAYKRIIVGGPGAPMRTALAQGLPIVFGFPVPSYFEQGWDPSTPLPLPGPSTQIIGGHCMVVCGYDFSLQRFHVPAFKIRNSWSASWGEAGYCWFDYRWFAAGESLAGDMWVVTKES